MSLDEGGERARLRQALHHRVEEARVAQVGHPTGLGDEGTRGYLGSVIRNSVNLSPVTDITIISRAILDFL